MQHIAKLGCRITLVTVLLLTVSLSSYARKYRFDKSFAFKAEQTEIKIESIDMLWGWGGLIINISMTNNGTKPFIFSSGDVEVLNVYTKEALYSCTKDKNMVTIPYEASKLNVLTNATEINPQRTVKGTILILAHKTQFQDLKDFDIIYAGQKTNVQTKG